jgi:glyoxylate reductase
MQSAARFASLAERSVVVPTKSLHVALTRRLPASIEARMDELFTVTFSPDDQALSRDSLADLMARHDVLVPTVTDHIDADLIAAAGPRLKLIANFGNGVDNIDVDAAYEKGITVTNTPSVLTEDTADMTLALILSVSRRLVEGHEIMHRPGQFTGWSPNWMLGQRVGGKKLGIIGMGRIGQAVARRAAVFGLEVHYFNRNPVHATTEAELNARYWPNLDRMLRHIDILSIHCPHTPATYHLMSARRLALMQPHVIIINTSRGEVIDEAALASALADGHLGGAGLDVFEREPAVNPALLKLSNVTLIPHMSSATREGRQSMGEKVMINIRTHADGHRPPDRVLPSSASV